MRRFCEGYRIHKYGVAEDDALAAGRWLIPLIPPLRCFIDAGMRHLTRPISESPRLLDIGCGNGDFLAKACGMGWKVKGLDFDEKAVAVGRARGFDVICGSVDALDHESSCYDVITISHVIEHVHDPQDLLIKANKLLKPGGKLWIETPNINSLGHELFSRNWFALDPPRHLTVLSPDALNKLLRAAGFKNLQKKFHGLATCSQFAASEALAEGRDPWVASREGNPPLSDLLAETYEFFFSDRREFLTVLAEKS